MSMSQPIVRIAPSPTGNLHIGTARTALYNFLFARKYGGTFILRIEDTDRLRSTKAFEDNIVENLAWLGLTHDTFVRQSERTQLYTKALQNLIDNDKAYISKEERKDAPGELIEVVRLKNPGSRITFSDTIHGDITFDTTELGDFVIARAIDDPLYHFAVVFDDGEMGITHVIRGEDHISNTPRQILIQDALGYTRPQYAHIPLILAPDRSKLSKRAGATSITEYRDAGYLPSALTNYLALLGWNPGGAQEIFTMNELTNAFDLSRIHKAGAIFDLEKLQWFNHEHLKQVSDTQFLDLVKTHLTVDVTTMPQYTSTRLERALPILRERVRKMSDVDTLAREGELAMFFDRPSYDVTLLSFKGETPLAEIRVHLETVIEALSNINDEQFGAETIKASVWDYATEVGRGAVLWPMRYALSGKEKSPDPFSLAQVLGKIETIDRLRNAIAQIDERL